MKHLLQLFLYLIIYTFFVSEIKGQSVILKIEAETEIPPELLKNISTNTAFATFSELETETSRILAAFQKTGFIDSRLISVSKLPSGIDSEKDITYKATYFLGPQFEMITIFYDQEYFNPKEIGRFVKQVSDDRFAIPISEVENTLTKLNNLQTEKGDAFAKIYLTAFKKDEAQLSARLISETTNKRTIDSIIIKGYEKFPRSYVRYVAGLKKGAVFKSSKIEKASTAIDALPFAGNLKPPEVLFKDKRTSLYLYLEKQKSNNFDGIIGFSTDDETKKLLFNGYLDLTLSNNLNFGETFVLNYKADGNAQQNFNAQMSLPYILRSPLGVDLGLNIFKQADNFSTTSQLAGLRYQINPNAIATLGYTGATSTQLNDETLGTENIMDFKKNEISAGTQWKFYQPDILFPVKATFGLLAGTGTKKIEPTDEKQIRLEANASYIIKLNRQNSFFVANKSALLDSDTYVTNELYRIGGINSIRGFKENTIEASLYSILNTEYRYRFSNLIYVHSIIDIGYIENQISDTKSSLYSFGLGTGFFTKTGLLKLSLANGKLQGQEFRFLDLKIHLSLITTF